MKRIYEQYIDYRIKTLEDPDNGCLLTHREIWQQITKEQELSKVILNYTVESR